MTQTQSIRLKPNPIDGRPNKYSCHLVSYSCISIITIIFDGFESNKKKIVSKKSTSIIAMLELTVNMELIQQIKHTITGNMNGDDDDDDDILSPSSVAPSPGVSPHIPRNKL
eukprot:338713_1